MLTEFKPKLDLQFDSQHIYQKSEVDQAPGVLDHPETSVSSRILGDDTTLRVTFLVVIERDGTVTSIRLTKSSNLPEFDQLMAAYIKEWTFGPAVKAGKKVRCMIEQTISVRRGGGSRFRT